MTKFNTFINSHFSSCRLLARAFDDCRNRDVTLHQIPGYWDVVGVSDGTDAWIAPVSAGPFFRTATGDLVKIMQALQNGEAMPPVPDAPGSRQKRRRAVLLDVSDTAPPPRPRTLLADPGAPAQGRRHVLT